MDQAVKTERRTRGIGWVHAAGTAAVFAAIAITAAFVDRSPPAEFVDGWIEPKAAAVDDVVSVVRHVRWKSKDRLCPFEFVRHFTNARGEIIKAPITKAPAPSADRMDAGGIIRSRNPLSLLDIVAYNNSGSSQGTSAAHLDALKNAAPLFFPPGNTEYDGEVLFYCPGLAQMWPIRLTAPTLRFSIR